MAVFLISILSAAVATFVETPLRPKWLALPALLLATLAFMGHLITLDDDSPGGWSNLKESKAVWYQSLRELLLKFAILALVGAFVVWQW